MTVTGTVIAGCPFAVALKLKLATPTCPPGILLQSTLIRTLFSGSSGETEPEEGERRTHDALDETVNVKGLGPPAPTSTKRLPKGMNGSRVSVGKGQL